MVTERGEQSDELSPKAKVSYDESKFQVKIELDWSTQKGFENIVE